jgi:GNAT superfamily N-acetyltransferase
MDRSTLVDRAESLVRVDARGRLAAAAPHLYVLRTPQRVVCRCHAGFSAEIAARLDQIARRERGRPRDWAREYGAYLDVLAAVGRARAVRAGPLFYVPELARSEDAAIRITEDNADLLLGGLDEWRPDVAADLPMAIMVSDGRAVSICATVHASATAHTAGVETLPAYRGRGLAVQAVAAWARMVQSLGATPFYATTFDNIASLSLASRLDLRLVGSEFSVECEPL